MRGNSKATGIEASITTGAVSRKVKEKNLQSEIMIALSRAGATVFRNNVGTGWVGKVDSGDKPFQTWIYPGDKVIRSARPLHAGLCKGSADIIGWVPVKITPEMVGHTFAVFLAPEIKTATGKASEEQLNFRNAVIRSGGRAGIARSSDDAVKIATGDM